MTDADRQKKLDSLDNYLNNLLSEDGKQTPVALELTTYSGSFIFDGPASDTASVLLNLQAMYSVDTAMDRDDFIIHASLDCGEYEYSEVYSKYMNKPMCASGDYIHGQNLSWHNTTTISATYSEEKTTRRVIYAIPARVDTAIDFRSKAVLERFIVGCTYKDDNKVAQNCSSI